MLDLGDLLEHPTQQCGGGDYSTHKPVCWRCGQEMPEPNDREICSVCAQVLAVEETALRS